MLTYPQIFCKLIENSPIDREILMTMRLVTEQLGDDAEVDLDPMNTLSDIKIFDLGLVIQFSDLINNQNDHDKCLDILYEVACLTGTLRILKRELEDIKNAPINRSEQCLISTTPQLPDLTSRPSKSGE